MTQATGQTSTFRVGLVQLRCGRTPQANVDAASKLIAQRKDAVAPITCRRRK